MERKVRVAVVDDEWVIREGFKKLFEWDKYGCEFAGEAADGAEALEIVEEKHPDVLVIDINLPILSGLKVIRKIKEKNPDFPIIVISGYDDFAYCQEALKLQVADYLLKPIDYEELGERIKRLKIQKNEKYSRQLEHHVEDKLIDQVLGYIREHSREEISLDVLSEKFHVGGAYISKKFKQETGINYHEYLTCVRMERAKELLINSSDTVTAIAEKAGFRDYRVFTKSFKEREGITPREYQNRKKHER